MSRLQLYEEEGELQLGEEANRRLRDYRNDEYITNPLSCRLTIGKILDDNNDISGLEPSGTGISNVNNMVAGPQVSVPVKSLFRNVINILKHVVILNQFSQKIISN